MKSKKDEVLSIEHVKYEEFNREQYIVDLDVGDKVKIQILDKNDKIIETREFIARYINCHINCQWQDKGTKKN